MEKWLNESILLANGYERFGRTVLDSKNIVCNFKKNFYDDKGKGKYVVVVHKWDNGFIPVHCSKDACRYGYEYTVQIMTKFGKTADLTFRSDWELWEVEDLAEELFCKGELCFYDDLDVFLHVYL